MHIAYTRGDFYSRPSTSIIRTSFLTFQYNKFPLSKKHSPKFLIFCISLVKSQPDRYALSIPINIPALHHLFFPLLKHRPNTFIPILSKPFILAGLMASSHSKPAPVKRLGEFLQEQQEPFLLDIYLLERGYVKKSMNSESRSGSSCNSNKNLKNLRTCASKRRNRLPHCLKILRSVRSKFPSINDNLKMLNFDCRDHKDGSFSPSKMGGRTSQVAGSDHFSSACSMPLFDSCSEESTEEESPTSQQNHVSSSAETTKTLNLCSLKEKQFISHKACRLTQMENFNGDAWKKVGNSALLGYCSRTNQKETPSTSSFNLPKKATEDSIFSACLWELLVQSPIEKHGYIGIAEVQKLVGSGSSSQYLKTKRVLQQNKQLLFDCVREAVESHGRKGRRQQQIHEFLGPEELGRIICRQICMWGRHYGDITNISQLIDFFAEEWSDLQPNIMDIGMAIGDSILDDIRNEIVTDMIDFFAFNIC